jgi:hypothetical protein
MGYQAGYSNTTGSHNTFIGDRAGYSFNTSGNTYNTCIGYAAGYSLTTGIENFFAGQNTGFYVTTGSKNTIIGGYDGNQGGIDIRTASNNVVISDGDGNIILGYLSASNTTKMQYVYSNTTSDAANVAILSSGTIARSTSALKYKQDIRDLEEMNIGLLRPVRYKSKCAADDQTKDHLGIIADEAAASGFEDLISYNADNEVEGFQYERLTVVLLKTIQALETRIAALEAN